MDNKHIQSTRLTSSCYLEAWGPNICIQVFFYDLCPIPWIYTSSSEKWELFLSRITCLTSVWEWQTIIVTVSRIHFVFLGHMDPILNKVNLKGMKLESIRFAYMFFVCSFSNKCLQTMSYSFTYLSIHCLPFLECQILWAVTLSFPSLNPQSLTQ